MFEFAGQQSSPAQTLEFDREMLPELGMICDRILGSAKYIRVRQDFVSEGCEMARLTGCHCTGTATRPYHDRVAKPDVMPQATLHPSLAMVLPVILRMRRFCVLFQLQISFDFPAVKRSLLW